MTAAMGVDVRMRLARLCLRTDTRRATGDLGDFVTATLAGGVDVVQVDEPGVADGDLLAALAVVREAARPYQALVLATGSPSVAAQTHADGLQFGATDGPAGRARGHLSRWAHVGRECRSEREVDDALADPDIDSLRVGPGLEVIRYAVQAAPQDELDAKPVWAVGGINVDTVAEVIDAGARRVVVTRALTEVPDPRRAAEQLHSILVQAWREPSMQRYLAGAAGGRSRLTRG